MAEPPSGEVSPLLLPASLAVDMLPMEKALGSKDEFTPSPLGFPSEFPFEFDSPTLSSAFTSPGDSTETEGESSDDEEDFLAGLTRRLALSTQRLPPPTFANEKNEEKRQVVSTSPQSTLSVLGSWSASGSGSPNGPSSQVPSPPTTPFRKDDTWDVISAAAGQVARLKIGGGEPLLSRPNPNPNSLLRCHAPAPGPMLPHLAKPQNAAFCSDQGFQHFYSHTNPSSQILLNESEAKQQFYADWVWHSKRSYYQSQLKFISPEQQISRRKVSGVNGCENMSCVRPSSWLQSPPPRQQASAGVRSVFSVGTASKRPCAGTGVFLPRRYTNPSESRKKSGNSSVVFPSKVVHPQNLNFDDFNDLVQPHSRPCLMAGHSQLDYESLTARRSGLLVRQGSLRPVPGGCLNQERPLPQEWMY